MKKVSQRWQLLFFLFIALGWSELQAKHIIGTELTYRCLGPTADGLSMRFEFTAVMYRDCEDPTAAPFDMQAEFGVYRRDSATNRITFYRTLTVRHGAVVGVRPEDDPCVIFPPRLCIETTSYKFDITLPLFKGSYTVSYQRCCRNNDVSNIIGSGDSGSTTTVDITQDALWECNSSPVFKLYPPVVICLDRPLDFDHSATDVDGDQLVYEFCAPLLGGGPFGSNERAGNPRACDGITPDPSRCLPPYNEVRYQPSFRFDQPMAGIGENVVKLNAQTGMITGTPNLLGLFVVGVCVSEYRNGKRIGYIRRDFQFNVAQCEETVKAEIVADTVREEKYEVRSCGSFTIDFINKSYQEKYIKDYYWEFDIRGNRRTSAERNASIEFPGLGIYNGKMIINRGLQCADSVLIKVEVLPDIMADFSYVYDTCTAGPVSFTDRSRTGAPGGITKWTWNFGDGSTSSSRTPQHIYKLPGNIPVSLQVEDANQCRDTKRDVLPYFPVPALIVVEPSTFRGCAPANIFFNNLSFPIDSTYEITWDFGDGTSSKNISPTHLYEKDGTFGINLSIVSPIGCKTSANFPDWITVRPSPQAGFRYSPEEPSNTQPVVEFKDDSKDASQWLWFFGAENSSTLANPIYTFRDTGVYQVSQIVSHLSGCTDTAIALIDVKPNVNYYLPNAFSPNNDGVNDEFFGKGNTPWMQDFSFSIWNRWGQLIFETTNPDEGWNGRMNNSGTDVPNGVYVCVVRYRGPRGDQHEVKGFATVVR